MISTNPDATFDSLRVSKLANHITEELFYHLMSVLSFHEHMFNELAPRQTSPIVNEFDREALISRRFNNFDNGVLNLLN
jgi:hypothetical protein